jgi:hypothetical protein
MCGYDLTNGQRRPDLSNDPNRRMIMREFLLKQGILDLVDEY